MVLLLSKVLLTGRRERARLKPMEERSGPWAHRATRCARSACPRGDGGEHRWRRAGVRGACDRQSVGVVVADGVGVGAVGVRVDVL